MNRFLRISEQLKNKEINAEQFLTLLKKEIENERKTTFQTSTARESERRNDTRVFRLPPRKSQDMEIL